MESDGYVTILHGGGYCVLDPTRIFNITAPSWGPVVRSFGTTIRTTTPRPESLSATGVLRPRDREETFTDEVRREQSRVAPVQTGPIPCRTSSWKRNTSEEVSEKQGAVVGAMHSGLLPGGGAGFRPCWRTNRDTRGIRGSRRLHPLASRRWGAWRGACAVPAEPGPGAGARVGRGRDRGRAAITAPCSAWSGCPGSAVIQGIATAGAWTRRDAPDAVSFEEWKHARSASRTDASGSTSQRTSPTGPKWSCVILSGDELDDEERARLHASLDRAIDDEDAGRIVDAKEFLAEVCAET